MLETASPLTAVPQLNPFGVKMVLVPSMPRPPSSAAALNPPSARSRWLVLKENFCVLMASASRIGRSASQRLRVQAAIVVRIYHACLKMACVT